MKIGFIGLGIMGSRMAANLQKGGHTLIVHNRTRDKAEPLLAGGAAWAGSPAAVAAQAEIVFTMLAPTQAVTNAALGPDGLLSTLAPGRLWVDCSTVNPSFSRKMAMLCRSASIASSNRRVPSYAMLRLVSAIPSPSCSLVSRKVVRAVVVTAIKSSKYRCRARKGVKTRARFVPLVEWPRDGAVAATRLRRSARGRPLSKLAGENPTSAFGALATTEAEHAVARLAAVQRLALQHRLAERADVRVVVPAEDERRPSPHDIVDWQLAPAVLGATYRAEARSVVVLFVSTST